MDCPDCEYLKVKLEKAYSEIGKIGRLYLEAREKVDAVRRKNLFLRRRIAELEKENEKLW